MKKYIIDVFKTTMIIVIDLFFIVVMIIPYTLVNMFYGNEKANKMLDKTMDLLP